MAVGAADKGADACPPPDNAAERGDRLQTKIPGVIPFGDKLICSDRIEVITIGGSGYVYKVLGGLAYKMHACDREVDIAMAAGDCTIAPLYRVTREIGGSMVTDGFVMELATPFNFKSVPPQDRKSVKDEMVTLVSRLHDEYGIVHGDIKPPNFLRCRDGKLRLCDFDSAR